MTRITFDNLDFSNSNQSLLATGDGGFEFRRSATHDWTIYEDWNAVIFDLLVDLKVGIGAEFGIQGSIGGIDTRFSYTPSATFSDGLRGPAGQVFTYLSDLDTELRQGQFSTNPINIGMDASVLYKAEGEIDFDIFGYDVFSIPEFKRPIGSAAVNDEGYGKLRIIDVSPNSIGLFENPFSPGSFLVEKEFAKTSFALTANMATPNLTLETRGNDKILDNGGPFGKLRTEIELLSLGPTFDLATLDLQKPNPVVRGSVGQRVSLTENADFTMSGTGADSFAELRLDIDGILSYFLWHYAKIPFFTELSQGFDWGVVKGDINFAVLDIDFGPDLRVRQEVEVTPGGLDTVFDFFDMEGNPTTIGVWDAAQDRIVQRASWSGNWDDVPAFELTEAVEVRQRHSTHAHATSVTGIELGLGFSIDFLRLQYSGSAFGAGFSGQLGPLVSLNFTEDGFELDNATDAGNAGLFVPLVPQDGTRLEGYQTHTGVSFILDVADTDDPGLSGFHDPENLGRPVAVEDDLRDLVVGEGTSITFDGARLIANDYDLTARDTLSLQSVSTGVDWMEAVLNSNGTVTVFLDGDVPGLTEGEIDTATLDYVLRDRVGNTGAGTAVVSVQGGDAPPVAGADAYFLTPGTVGPLSSRQFDGLLDNDSGGDPGVGVQVVAGTYRSDLGTPVVVRADGSFSYTFVGIWDQINALDGDRILVDAFDYTIVAEDGQRASAEVSVISLGSAQAGELAQQVVFLPKDARNVISVDGDPESYVVFLSYQPDPGQIIDVVVQSNNENYVTVTNGSLSFTEDNWDKPQIVQVSAAEGADLNGNTTGISTTLSLGATPRGSQPGGPGSYFDTRTLELFDTPSIEVRGAGYRRDVREGQSLVLTVEIDAPYDYTDNITLKVSSAELHAAGIRLDDGFGNDVDTLRIGPDAEDDGIFATLEVHALDDDIADPGQIANIRFEVVEDLTAPAFRNMDPVTFRVNILDNEPSAPILSSATWNAVEDTPLTLDALADDFEPNGEAMAITAASARNGSVVINDDGTLTYTPNANYFSPVPFGADVLTYTVEDAAGYSTQWREIIRVAGRNDPIEDRTSDTPTYLVDEDSVVTVDLNAFFFEPDGQEIAFTVTGLSVEGGSAVIQDGILTVELPQDYTNMVHALDADGFAQVSEVDGSFLYQLAPGAAPLTVSYTVRDVATDLGDDDAVFLAVPKTLDLLVIPVEDPPEAGADVFELAANETLQDIEAAILSNDSDGDGDALSVGQTIQTAFRLIGTDVDVDTVWPDEKPFSRITRAHDDGPLTFTPSPLYAAMPEGMVAEEVHQYELVDEFGNTGIGEITIRIAGVNDSPYGVLDVFHVTLDQDGSQSITVLDGLAENDLDPDYNEEVVLPSVLSSPIADTPLGARVLHAVDGLRYADGVYYQIDGAFSLAPGEVVIDTFQYESYGSGGDYFGDVAVVVRGGGAYVAQAGIVVSQSALTVQEDGAGDTVLVALTEAPDSDVTLRIVYDDETEAYAERETLTFTPETWNIPQAVTVLAINDGAYDGDQVTALRFETDDTASDAFYAGAVSDDITVTVRDSAPAAEIWLTQRIVLLDEGGPTEAVNVQLGQRPDSDVTVAVQIDGAGLLEANRTEFIFTPANWDSPQVLRLSAPDNFDFNTTVYDSVSLRVRDAASDPAFAGQQTSVLAFVDDDEAEGFLAAPPQITFTPPRRIIREGDTGELAEIQFTVTRSGEYLGARSLVEYVVIGTEDIGEEDFEGGAFPFDMLEFLPGETEKTVTVRVAGNATADGAKGIALVTGFSKNAEILSPNVIVPILDDEDLVLEGDAEDNALYGFAGADSFIGFAGNDTFTGSLGLDHARYDLEGGSLRIVVDQSAGTVTDTFGDEDRLISVERVTGTAFADQFTGSDGSDFFDGGAGNDRFYHSLGRDVLNGEDGNDALDYRAAGAGVSVFLHRGFSTGDGFRHVFTSMEAVSGSDFRDVIVADGSTFSVLGYDGDDVLRSVAPAGEGPTFSGGAGDDTLVGSDADERMFGGNDNDVLRAGRGADYANMGQGDDVARLGADEDRGIGGLGADRLFGNGGNDQLEGNDGSDRLDGGRGADVLKGDAGNDALRGGSGVDTLLGGAGDDTLYGGSSPAGDGNRDSFVFAPGGGTDRIKDFENGKDLLDLTAFGFASFDSVLENATNSGSTAMRLDFADGSRVVIESFRLADFDASDVLL